jgi:hypothetical protein
MAAKKNSHNEEKHQGQAHFSCCFGFSTPVKKTYLMQIQIGYILTCLHLMAVFVFFFGLLLDPANNNQYLGKVVEIENDK